jgi:hypothetical protein
LGFQTAHLVLKASYSAGEGCELSLELIHQTLQFVGHFGDAIETGVEQGSRLVAGHGLPTLVGAVGIAGHTAVLLNQVAQRLVSPVGGLNIRKLGDAGDLVLGFPSTEAINVLLLHVVVDGGSAIQRRDFIGNGGDRRQYSRSSCCH